MNMHNRNNVTYFDVLVILTDEVCNILITK